MTIDARPTAAVKGNETGQRLRILKFPLPVWGPTELRTARLARFLDVGWQDGHPVVWAEALPGDNRLDRLFVAMTGDEVDADAEYIGTVQTLDAPTISPYVVHVYRVAS